MRRFAVFCLLGLATAGLLGAVSSPVTATIAERTDQPQSLEAITRLNRTLPRVAARIAEGRSLRIVAFGSSSTEGEGASSPANAYPNRLQAELRARYPGMDIVVINLGVRGEDAKEMLARIDSVMAARPDLILWQVGTNAITQGLSLARQRMLIRRGLAALAATGADIVLMDPQYTPTVVQCPNVGQMIRLLDRLATEHNISVFHRYAAMRHWHQVQRIPFDRFTSDDDFHMNDWGYGRIASLIADVIIEASLRRETPARVLVTSSRS